MLLCQFFQCHSACILLPGDENTFYTVLFWMIRKLHAHSVANTSLLMCLFFQGAECWTDGHTADMSFPPQIFETMWAQINRHLHVSTFVGVVIQH